MLSGVDQLKNIYAHVPPVIGFLKERLSSASENVRSWCVTPSPEVTSLNQKFIQKIRIVHAPLSRKELIESMIVIIASAVIGAYSIGWSTAGAFGWKAVGILGVTLGGWGIVHRVQGMADAVKVFKCRKVSPEERLFKQYAQYTQGEIQVKFKHYTKSDIELMYTPLLKQEILKCTEAGTLEQAVIPPLIRLIVLQEEYDALQKKCIHDLAYIPKGRGKGSWCCDHHGLKEVKVRADEVNILLHHENTVLQNLYTKKMELAFALAILLYPDEIKYTSLDQMGNIYNYSTHPSFLFYHSNLPFFISYPATSVHVPRTRPILCSELASLSIYCMARLFAFPGDQ